MGTILSPTNLSQVYKGQVVPVSYRSDTVDFSCGSLSKICVIQYSVNGIPVTGFVGISQTGVAPQIQADENITMPLTGATAQIDIDARGVGGQQNDTSTVTVNLVDVPTVSCGSALVTDTTAQLQANITGTLIAGGSIQFRYGTTVGGPYTTTVVATPYAVGGVTANITGLIPNTAYYFVFEVLDNNNNLVVNSSECSFTTANTVTSNPSEALLVKVCTITGVTLLRDCTNDTPILLITVTSSDGDIIPTDSTEFVATAGAGVFTTIGFYRSYYTDLTGNYLNPQPTNVCSPSSVDLEAVEFCLKANTAGTGYAVNDQIKLTKWFNTATNTQVSEVAFNVTNGGTLVTTPLTGADFDECSTTENTIQTVIEGYQVTVNGNTNVSHTFGVPVRTLSLGNIGSNILKLTLVTNPVSIGNTFQYVMPSGTVALDAGNGYTFISLVIDNLGSGQSTILINGVTSGNV